LSVLDKQAQGVFLRAGYLANLDMQNLNNRQQAAVVNSQAFLAMDMKNLDMRQQAAIINTQSRLQAMLSDQAAINTAQQFNANSQQQVDEFYADLGARISTFNAAQANAMNTANTSEVNAMTRFNSSMENEREAFNTNSRLQVDQSNVQYLRGINTANTAALNQANYINSQNLLSISNTAIANEFQLWRDSMTYAFQHSENELDRAAQTALVNLNQQNWFQRFKADEKSGFISAVGDFASGLFSNWLLNKFPVLAPPPTARPD
jgi:hypothetical protein